MLRHNLFTVLLVLGIHIFLILPDFSHVVKVSPSSDLPTAPPRDPEVTTIIPKHANIQEEIGKLVNRSKVVVFMKGVPANPQCGFSNSVVMLLRMHGAPFEAHDVLQDHKVREGIKEFSNWPTIPQVFIGGEFVGGSDIMLQLHRSGELAKELAKVGIKSIAPHHTKNTV